jgi:hypothetical protein
LGLEYSATVLQLSARWDIPVHVARIAHHCEPVRGKMRENDLKVRDRVRRRIDNVYARRH